MGLKRLVLGMLFLMLLSPLGGLAQGQGSFAVTVSGAVERDFAGGEIFFESTPVGRQIYLQKAGPGEDLLVLTVILPPNERPGEYDLSTFGSITANYFEVVGGVSRQFTENIQGKLTITESGERFSGKIEFRAQEGSQSISVTGTFEKIPFGSPDPAFSAPADPEASTRAVIGVSLVFLFFLLLILNFIFQYFVGARVYADNSYWRWLNGTRTFVLGWQDVRLYPLMILWSVLLVVIVIVIVLVFITL